MYWGSLWVWDTERGNIKDTEGQSVGSFLTLIKIFSCFSLYTSTAIISFRNPKFLNRTMPTVTSVSSSTFQVEEASRRALDLVGTPRTGGGSGDKRRSQAVTLSFLHPMISRLSHHHRHRWPSKTLLLPGKPTSIRCGGLHVHVYWQNSKSQTRIHTDNSYWNMLLLPKLFE